MVDKNLHRKVPIVISLGTGGRIYTRQIHVADIADSYNCKLARYAAKRLHAAGISTDVKMVFTQIGSFSC